MPRARVGTVMVSLIVSVFALLVVAYAFSNPLRDFIEYWTTAHLLLTHQNPYSLPDTLHIQQGLGWRETLPLIPLNPPWTLALLAPLGLATSYPLAWLAWITMLAAAIALSSRLLMDLYFGEIKLPDITDSSALRSLFAFSFFPTILCLEFAQTAPFVLLGVAGFLHFERKRQPLLAGLLFSLTAVKPQLVYLVWLALFLTSIKQRRWKTPAAAVAVICFLTTVALALDHKLIREYWELANGPYPHTFASGMTLAVRRAFLEHDTFWVQFVPPVIGLIWFVSYWRKHSENWSWIERAPTLVTVSLLTTAWGFIFDQTLLAIPIIALAAKAARELGHLPRNLVVVYTALNVLLIGMVLVIPPWVFIPAPVVIAILLFRNSAGKGKDKDQFLYDVGVRQCP